MSSLTAAIRSRRSAVVVSIVAVLATVTAIYHGVPFDREQVLVWVVGCLLVLSLVAGASIGRLLRDWVPFAVLLLAYDFTRGLADTLGRPVTWTIPADIDSAIFGRPGPVVLQEWITWPRQPAWWELPIALTYASHFIVPYVLLGILWWRDHDRWVQVTIRFFVLTAMGLATYLLVPAAPPWLVSRRGLIAPVDRVASRGWSVVGLDIASRFIDAGQRTSNLVAALPSLHAAYPALFTIEAFRAGRPRIGVVLAVYTLAMGFVLVLSAEHFVVDVLLGWLYAALASGAVTWWEHRRRARAVVAPA